LVEKYSSILDDNIKNERDFNFDYFGFKTLQRSYLLKDLKNNIVERPQYLYMRIALAICKDNIDDVIKTYDLLSEGYYTHATPTMFNAGTNLQQLSSCFLLKIDDDSLDEIYKILSDTAKISKLAGGIGISISKIRAKNSKIKGTNGLSDGIIPMLKVYNETARYVNQSGKRKGSFAIYIEPWHDDIFDFVDLRKNHGKEEIRARDLFLAIWTNDMFMEAVVNDTDWYLMCPNESPGLHDCYGQEFKDLYEKYIIEGNFRRKIKARDLWSKIIENQIETGVPYILHKDSINEKSNQKNIGVISSSNLCCEIVEYTSKEEQSVCNLSSIGLPKLVNENGFDFNKLYDVAYMSIKNLDRVIDINYYPTKETQLSNSKHRPVGSGINGLADVFAMLKLPFDSVEAKELSKKISETIYFASLTASNDLAIEKGKYLTFDGSPTSKGILQYDMWENRTVANNKILNSEPIKLSGMWDFDSLKEKIIKYGLRNSLLTTILPSASTAQILGNNECIEPFTSNIYSRKTLSGEFVLTNKHLIKELIDLKLWSDDIRKKIIINNGSVQNIEEIPSDIRYRYRTVWEMKMKDIIDMSADRAPFICQTQSLNLFFKDINYAKLTGSLIYGWLKGLKTGSYYIRQDVSTKANNMLGLDTTTSKKSEIEEIACSLDNPEDCLACSA
jgi:ribonucleoside-diphosphate reductase alpha chain